MLELIAGVGNYADWTATDALDCCCPVIRRFLIRLNDSDVWDSDRQRTEMLSPLIPLLIDSLNPELIQKRALMLADFAVRKIAPISLRRAKQDASAAMLEALPEIVDELTARTAAVAAVAAVAVAAAAAAGASDAARRSADVVAAAARRAADVADAAAAAASDWSADGVGAAAGLSADIAVAGVPRGIIRDLSLDVVQKLLNVT
jgi:hypothetical protein